METLSKWVLGLGVAALIATGCASRQYVDEQMSTSADRIGALEEKLSDVQGEVAGLKQSDAARGEEIARLSETAQEALDRARDAGQLAKGQFLYELRFSDNSVKFGFDDKALSPEAANFLDAFAARLKEENRDVFIEIQGHTDSTGPEKYNRALGMWRAKMVMRHLHMSAGIPIHRMRAVSYGEEMPLGDNSTPEGRARNRSVVLMVME